MDIASTDTNDLSGIRSETSASQDRAVTSPSRTSDASPTPAANQASSERAPGKKRKRKSTSHLKAVPPTLAGRERIKAAAEQLIPSIDVSRPFTKNELETYARNLMEELGEPEKYLGFTMVMIGNFYWKRQLISIPFERRMLLLPHCLKHAEGCPAEYDEFGLDCEKCGACSIADYKVRAEQLGYKVLVAEGSPIVLKIIVEGYIDGIVGVACLNVLEKAIDKVLLAGVPSYAIPLHSGDCKNTSLDEAWVWDVLEVYEPLPEQKTSSYLPLMRATESMFGNEDEFERLLPSVRGKSHAPESPIAFTESISYDYLRNGGKRFRPFVTLAAYDAFANQEHKEQPDLPDAVKRAAMAIEAFHKASLVHDDIQDDDHYRYGRETLHRQYDVGQAINIGDYLVGLGYKLLNATNDGTTDPAAVCDITARMAQAHLKLCEGQGAEMSWTANPSLELKPLDALQIYALKTSPAFEAALYSGLRLGGNVEHLDETISQFSRQIGVGFQILNDLKDWAGDNDNKMVAGQDAGALRPTVLFAMAIEKANDQQKEQLQQLCDDDSLTPQQRVEMMGQLYKDLEVLSAAETLVDRSRERAVSLAESIENETLQRLMFYFVDTILADERQPPPEEKELPLVSLSLPSR